MRKHSAAPGVGSSGAAGTSTGNPLSIAQLPGLPPHIIATLAEESVLTVADWLALGIRRREIFGITAAKVDVGIALARRFGLLKPEAPK